MRTLLLTQVVPNPPDAGPKVKTHYVLRTLARRHSVELLTFARSPEEEEAAQALAPWCDRITTVPLERRKYLEPWYMARGWARGTPFLVSRDARRAFSKAVRDRLAEGDIDILHADQLTMAQYLPLAKGTGVTTVFDAHNAVWDLVRTLVPRQPTPLHRTASRIEWRLLKRFEGRACRDADFTLVVADQDRDALEAAAGEAIRSCTVPIGVEVLEQPVVEFNPRAKRLLSVATMHYPPNAEAIRWFRDRVWPGLRHADPELGVDIVGARPPADLVEWAAADARIDVHGYVADLDDLYREAAVFIVPLLAGSGVRVKVLEAMARGVPVVSTSIGIEGLDLVDGLHVCVADTGEAFSAAIRELVDNPARRLHMVEAARRHVLERYDWRVCCQPLLDVYDSLRPHAVREHAVLD